MKASVGDRLVMASSVVGGAVRDGRVVEVRGADGAPPYMVEWTDTGETTLVFPGPDSHVEHYAGAAPPSPTVRHLGTWTIQVTLAHTGTETTAHAVLVGSDADQIGAAGHARRNPSDPAEPVIGDEIAVARALRHLADGLIDIAEEHIEDSTGRPARVHT